MQFVSHHQLTFSRREYSWYSKETSLNHLLALKNFFFFWGRRIPPPSSVLSTQPDTVQGFQAAHLTHLHESSPHLFTVSPQLTHHAFLLTTHATITMGWSCGPNPWLPKSCVIILQFTEKKNDQALVMRYVYKIHCPLKTIKKKLAIFAG